MIEVGENSGNWLKMLRIHDMSEQFHSCSICLSYGVIDPPENHSYLHGFTRDTSRNTAGQRNALTSKLRHRQTGKDGTGRGKFGEFPTEELSSFFDHSSGSLRVAQHTHSHSIGSIINWLND